MAKSPSLLHRMDNASKKAVGKSPGGGLDSEQCTSENVCALRLRYYAVD